LLWRQAWQNVRPKTDAERDTLVSKSSRFA